MKVFRKESRRIVTISAILVGAVVTLGLIPWKLVSAEAQDAAAPKLQYMIEGKVLYAEPGGPVEVIEHPKSALYKDQGWQVQVGDELVEMAIHTRENESGMKHVIESELKMKSDDANLKTIRASRIELEDCKWGKVTFAGSKIQAIEVRVTNVTSEQ